MNEFKDPKELKMAMNGRMGLMTGGILLIFTAISSTLMYGINMFSLASGAADGNAEYTELLSTANISISLLRAVAVCFIVLACVEVCAGLFCTLRCNRMDKANLTTIASIALLAVEIIMQLFLAFARMMNLASLFTSLIIPLYLLWSATRLRKLAKIYPDRINAMDTKKLKAQRQARQSAPAAPAPKKSLHERAMMNTGVSEEEREADDTTDISE